MLFRRDIRIVWPSDRRLEARSRDAEKPLPDASLESSQLPRLERIRHGLQTPETDLWHWRSVLHSTIARPGAPASRLGLPVSARCAGHSLACDVSGSLPHPATPSKSSPRNRSLAGRVEQLCSRHQPRVAPEFAVLRGSPSAIAPHPVMRPFHVRSERKFEEFSRISCPWPYTEGILARTGS